MCSVYMKARNISYFLYTKVTNMEGFQDLPEHLHLRWEVDIQCLENSGLGVV